LRILLKRYERNVTALSFEENELLKNFKICVIGCGGLGGYVIESLGRLGVGNITAVDGDVFEESNLNRQLLSDESVLGKSKAEAAKNRMEKVNSNIKVTAINEYITEDNSEKIIKGHDIVIDALDNITARLIIENEAQKRKIPLVHGAIAGWYGQVSVIMPGAPIYDKLYQESAGKGMENELGNLPFTAALVASVQASEVIKVLLKRSNVLSGKLLTIDLLSQEYEIYEI
jgi:molybdopterin/thiamine biosynthesis adenylyltransferase